MPTFGRAMLDHFCLEPGAIYLNHGTVGATPRRVLAAQQAIRDEIERHPSRFMLRELSGSAPAPWLAEPRLRTAARAVGAFVGARAEDLVFVPNVTTGLNAVLQSRPLAAGDEIVMTELGYGAITLAAESVARARGASVVRVALPCPIREPGTVVDAVRGALTARTALAVVDHVTAQSALVLPIHDIVAACHERGVPVLVDGAHAPGSIALDVASIGADWYAANLHKWALAPRSCGFLWARPDRQDGLRHPVVSWGSGGGFIREFEWNATADPSCYLAAPEAIALLQDWGWTGVLAYIHGLAWDAAALLADRWGTRVETPRGMIGAMVTVPLPEAAGSTDADATRVRLALLVDDRIEVQLHAWKGRLHARVSAQVYNDVSDVARLAEAVARRLP